MDRPGQVIETYGSEGWGFESLRVRHVMSRDTVGRCLGTSLHFRVVFGIPASMVAPFSPGSRPGPCGWPAASLDLGCGRQVGPGSGCRSRCGCSAFGRPGR